MHKISIEEIESEFDLDKSLRLAERASTSSINDDAYCEFSEYLHPARVAMLLKLAINQRTEEE